MFGSRVSRTKHRQYQLNTLPTDNSGELMGYSSFKLGCGTKTWISSKFFPSEVQDKAIIIVNPPQNSILSYKACLCLP